MGNFMLTNEALDYDLRSYHQLEMKISELTNQRNLLERKIIDTMGENTGIMSPLGKITYDSQDKRTTNWKKVVEEMMIPPEMVAKHTSVKQVKSFRTYWSKDV